MIQRIQSLFLLIAVILMGIYCFVPFISFLHGGEIFRQTAWGINSTGDVLESVVRTIPMGILSVLATLLPLVIIFLYKKRELQMRLCVVEMILLLGVCIYTGMFLFRSASDISDQVAFSITVVFPLLSIVLTFIAFKRIMKDAILIKSLNRIR